MLREAYGDQAMSRACAFKWHRRFRESEEDVEDKPRSGRPSASKTDENVEAVRQAVEGDRRLTVRMIANCLADNYQRPLNDKPLLSMSTRMC